MGQVKLGLGAVGALPVSLLVVSIGLSLGGTTGYAINPARDLIPRIVHAGNRHSSHHHHRSSSKRTVLELERRFIFCKKQSCKFLKKFSELS